MLPWQLGAWKTRRMPRLLVLYRKCLRVYLIMRYVSNETPVMVWLRADMPSRRPRQVRHFGVLFVQSMKLGCVAQNFSRAWINDSSNHKTSNITDHANICNKCKNIHVCINIHIITCIFYCAVAIKHNYHVRTTFSDGKPSCIVV